MMYHMKIDHELCDRLEDYANKNSTGEAVLFCAMFVAFALKEATNIEVEKALKVFAASVRQIRKAAKNGKNDVTKH